jgi:hypothetical protein
MLIREQNATQLREQENLAAETARLGAIVEYVAIMADVDLDEDEEEGVENE